VQRLRRLGWPRYDLQSEDCTISADADFQKTMQLQMKEGKWFSDDNADIKHGFILNETAVKDFKLKSR